jgi:hypothetical protein
MLNVYPACDAYGYPVYAGPPAFLPSVLPPVDGDRCAGCGYVHTGNCPNQRGKYRGPEPIDTADYREIMARDAAARFAEIEAARRPYVRPVVPAPQVPARAVAAPSEIAGYQGKQAVGLGRGAVAAGWTVVAEYWRGHDGGEGCAVKLARPPLRAVATWTRKPGQVGKLSGWSADVAYAWRDDVERVPTKINHTDLERIMFDDAT